ncbi:RNA methyltransferase [Methanophagales archaeon]|nr:MAG: RNA methyltransferase [Methanophagales archaeon]
MEIRTILVEPKLEENIGAVARAIKNFGFSELYLVNPPAIGEKAMAVASHAYDVLRACEKVKSVEEAIEDSTIVAGATSRHGISSNKHLRMPFFSPRELKEKVKGIGKSSILSILFGCEDTGLRREELVLCDLVVCIPTSSGYPVMNLSHAVAVVLYELSEVDGGMAAGTVKLASIEDKERLFMHMKTFLNEIGYKEHKKDKTMLMLRRILGRAELTGREVQTLRGILRKAEWKISKGS